jgi:hypothetical protein
VNRAAQIARHLLENNEDGVEGIATDWISAKEPRYSIEGGFLASGVAIGYDGRIFVYRAPRWEPANRWVIGMLFGTDKLSWEQARQKLESGGTYFGWIQINLQVGQETRQAWLANHPVQVRKMVRE